MNKLHVGVSPLTNRIFAGRVTKNGLYWREGKEDVTGSACAAVAEHALASKKPVVVFAGGKPCFEISVTGYSGCIRDVETGLFDKNGKFWLASGDFDIRKFGDITTREAIDKIKRNANTCTGE